MVAPGFKRIGETRKYRLTVMVDDRGLAMHWGGTTDNTAINVSDTLMSQANTQNGNLARKVAHYIVGNPRVQGGAWSGGDDYVGWG
jgi:hypothetical protein